MASIWFVTLLSTMTLPPWRPLLKGAQHREGRSPAARWLQLANVANDGTARVRTLVFRGWKDDEQLLLFTDGRSSKILELTHQPQVELCWLFPKAKQQFRLRGVMTLTKPEDSPAFHQQCWRSMRDSGRALWAWPNPGGRYDSSATFVKELAEDSGPPNHFWCWCYRYIVLSCSTSITIHIDGCSGTLMTTGMSVTSILRTHTTSALLLRVHSRTQGNHNDAVFLSRRFT